MLKLSITFHIVCTKKGSATLIELIMHNQILRWKSFIRALSEMGKIIKSLLNKVNYYWITYPFKI